MSWFPVDDALHSHPKARKAGDEALGFWTRAGSYCMAYLTDGFVPEWWVKEQPKGVSKAKLLVDAGFWLYPAEKDGEQGYQFHDWKPECTKAHVTEVREKARQRKEKQRESQRESQRDGPCDDTRESLATRARSQPNPTQPNPPSTSTLVTSDEKAKSVAAPVAVQGSRLAADWMPPTEVVAQMRSEHPTVDFKAEHAKFIDYWTGKAGKDARKADWSATWRNWIRRADELSRSANNNGTAGAKPPHKMRVLAELAAKQRAVEEAQAIEGRKELV